MSHALATQYPEWLRAVALLYLLGPLVPGLIVIAVAALNKHEPYPRRLMTIGVVTLAGGLVLSVILFGFVS